MGRVVVAVGLLALLLGPGDHEHLAAQPAGAASAPAHHLRHGFRNLDPAYSYSMLERTGRLLRRLGRPLPARGEPLGVAPNDGEALRANGVRPTITWVGHSTFLVQLHGINVLTDPHWGERASPVAFAGPRRLARPGLAFDDLPPIDAVVISHDHYDHLDETTVARLARHHDPLFIVPLGVRSLLLDMGARRVVELDWWEATRLGPLAFVCTPAQHSSGRGLHDQNRRLWSSWAIVGDGRRLFFAGDTGYFAGLREIGERLGPFELALVPIGGYSAYGARHPNHVSPEEAVWLAHDVRARVMVPMHWGTFEMNVEPTREPPERLLREASRRGMAEAVAVLAPGQTLHW